MNYSDNDQALKEANKVFGHNHDWKETAYDFVFCTISVVLIAFSIIKVFG